MNIENRVPVYLQKPLRPISAVLPHSNPPQVYVPQGAHLYSWLVNAH